MSIRKGSSIIAGNIGQNVDSALSPTSDNPVKNSVIYDAFQNTLSSDRITNCITEIPQDIVLELSGTTLTLKAGSKLYYPNGVDTFDTFTTTSDLVLNLGGSGWTNEKHMIVVNNDGTSSAAYAFQDVYSGATAPASLASQYGVWYDTTNNLVRRTTDTGSTWTTTPWSFPICIAINTGGTCDGVFQTFNGLGFIGSIVFALPGVKGLIPDGRNADGTLKNTEFVTSSVLTIGYDISYNNYKLALNSSSVGVYVSHPVDRLEYKEQENINYNNYTDAIERIACVGYISCNGTQITAFEPKNVFHALDWNDTEYIAHQAMPGKYIALTAVASGGTYTVPADGYLMARATAPATGKYLELIGGSIDSLVHSGDSGLDLAVYIPVQKGTVVTTYYTTNTPSFRFIYANGSI